MNEIKNLSRKSARPATIATKNQKHTMSLTTMSTDDGMYNRVQLRVCQRGCIKMYYMNVGKIKFNMLYILIVMYLDPKTCFERVLYDVCTIEEKEKCYNSVM